jgi:Tfp pilus assembly pilus retraction ATPase PilT
LSARRSRPDVILIGELLDLETVRVAIEAANKGHLVFATSHASSAAEAVSGLISQFPGSEQNQIATALSQALTAVVVQRLVPTVNSRLVPARELLLNTISISAKIRDMAFSSLTQALKLREGMYTFEDELAMLWAKGLISAEMAYKFANDREEMKSKLAFAAANKDEVAAASNRTVVGMNEMLGRQ